MASPKELKLPNDDGVLLYFAFIPALIALAFGALGVVGVVYGSTTSQKIANGLFVLIGCVGIYIFRVIFVAIFTDIHLRRNPDTLDIEWRRFGKVTKSVSSPISALAISISEGVHPKSNEPSWTVTMGTKTEDVQLGGPYSKREQAERRKALVAQFLELDAKA